MRSVVLSFLGLMFAAATATAQDPAVRTVDNPYQEGHPFRIGSEFTPNVEIDGVHWNLTRISTKDDELPETGRQNQVFVTLELDNRRERAVNLTVVLMLEDQNGSELERFSLPPLRLGATRIKQYRHKFKASGDDLLATRNVYLFCRVE